jgi:hypothetical protein
MIEKVKIQIEEDEWADTPREVRNRIMELMKEYGYDTKILEVLEREVNPPTPEDIFRQFYGDES